MQVGLTPKQEAELQGHTLETWRTSQLRLSKQKLSSKKISRYVGVSGARKHAGRWRVAVRTSVGRVDRTCRTEEDAARAYDRILLQDKGR